MLMNLLTMISRYNLKKERKKQILGKKLWWKLNEQLPQAYGAIENDRQRIDAFKLIWPTLNKREKEALKAWLKAEIYDLEHNSCEFLTCREEAYESRLRQIYEMHLAAIS